MRDLHFTRGIMQTFQSNTTPPHFSFVISKRIGGTVKIQQQNLQAVVLEKGMEMQFLHVEVQATRINLLVVSMVWGPYLTCKKALVVSSVNELSAALSNRVSKLYRYDSNWYLKLQSYLYDASLADLRLRRCINSYDSDSKDVEASWNFLKLSFMYLLIRDHICGIMITRRWLIWPFRLSISTFSMGSIFTCCFLSQSDMISCKCVSIISNWMR